jgi:hypothetical protein
MPSSAVAERSFLWWRTAEWEALGVWLTGIVTIGLLIYAVMQLREARGVRSDQTRPYVVVDFHFKSVMVALSVKNVGQTPAKNVRVKLDEPVTSAVMPSVEWQESGLFKDGVSMFAPGREMRFALDVMSKRRERGLPMTISGAIEYGRYQGEGGPWVEPFVIDLFAYGDALMAPKDVAWIGDEMERIRKILAKWQNMRHDELPIE